MRTMKLNLFPLVIAVALCQATDSLAAEGRYPCQVGIGSTSKKPGEVSITVSMQWQRQPVGLKESELGVVFLLQPVAMKARVPLDESVLAKRQVPYVLGKRDGLNGVISPIYLRDGDGGLFVGQVLVFFPDTASDRALTRSGKQTFVIPVQEGNHATGKPQTKGFKYLLDVALFRERDPDADQTKSKLFDQLSEAAMGSVDLNE